MIFDGTRSSFKVNILGKVVKIHGELLSKGFVAYKDSFDSWEPPNNNEEIDEQTRELIIQTVLEESNKKKLFIFFE